MKFIIKSTNFQRLFVLLGLFNICANSIHAAQPSLPQTVTVSAPVADIRIQNPDTNEISPFILPEKSENKSFFFADNKFQETQVLFGDNLNVIKENGEWLFVEIPSQKYFTESKELVSCNGWVNKSSIKQGSSAKPNLVVTSLWAPISFKTEQEEIKLNVSIGTSLSGKKLSDGSWEIASPFGQGKISDEHVQKIIKRQASIKDLRVDLIERAKMFLTSPYIWGGTSASVKFYPDPIPQNMLHQLTGIDCSGLVYVLFKSFGGICPRNSNDQFVFSEKIEAGKNLKPGDLIFFAKVGPDGKTPLRVTHVAIYAGNDAQDNSLIIESQGVAEPFGVRLIATKLTARLGNKQLSEIKTGDIFEWTDERTSTKALSFIYFGTFMTSSKLNSMRQDFLRS